MGRDDFPRGFFHELFKNDAYHCDGMAPVQESRLLNLAPVPIGHSGESFV